MSAPSSTGSRWGLDAVGRPCSPAQALKFGFTFVWHYLGSISRAEVDAYHAVGLDVALFWERGQFDAGAGTRVGRQHALEARAALADLGAPVGAATAADYDPQDPAEVAPYFQGWHEVLGPLAGGYGNYAVVEMLGEARLCPAGLVQKVSGSPGGAVPPSWSHVTVSRHAHFLQHNDAPPPGAPRIPGKSLLWDYDVEQQLVPSSPLLWRAMRTQAAARQTEADVPKLVRFVQERGDTRVYLEIDGVILWMAGPDARSEYAAEYGISEASTIKRAGYLAGRPGKLAPVPPATKKQARASGVPEEEIGPLPEGVDEPDIASNDDPAAAGLA